MIDSFHYILSPKLSADENLLWNINRNPREVGRIMHDVSKLLAYQTHSLITEEERRLISEFLSSENKGEDTMHAKFELVDPRMLEKERERVMDAWLIPGILKIVHNEEARTTTIHWADNTKTTVRCGEGEKYEKYNGFVACVAKKLFGSTSAAKRINGRKDEAYMKLQKQKEQQKIEEEAALKREQKERKIIKRRAKEIYLQREAEKLADEMAKKK